MESEHQGQRVSSSQARTTCPTADFGSSIVLLSTCVTFVKIAQSESRSRMFGTGLLRASLPPSAFLMIG
jgi:hypothetical protein